MLVDDASRSSGAGGIGHLIHVGYPKAGSTFLQRWFETHPHLAYAKGGIAGYSSAYQLVTEAGAGTRSARYGVTSSESLSIPRPDLGLGQGEQADRAEAKVCRILASLFPNANILIVTRGFRAMILSSYSQYVRTGGANPLDRMVEACGSEQPWQYDRLIGRCRESFGDDRVLVLPYELLRDHPEGFFGRIEAFLGLDHGPVPKERVNESLSGVELAWYPRLFAATRKLPFGASERLRRAAFANRLKPLIAILQRVSPRTAVTASLVTDERLEPFRGCAHSLRANPLYAPYAADYLL